MKRQVCMPKEGRELHGKVKRERERESKCSESCMYIRARGFSLAADACLSTRTCVYIDGSAQKLRLFRTTGDMERRREKKRDRRRREMRRERDRNRRGRKGGRERDSEREREREVERENLFEDSWV